MKEKILQTVFGAFEDWSASNPKACVKGCSACCTQQVMITALEGEQILKFILQEGRERWLAERLQMNRPTAPPPPTTNEYAEACLQGIESDDPGGAPQISAPCPFLDRDCCTIYPVRPFSCRCFASEKTCSSTEAAVLPGAYVAASTAMMQIIEHLGQHEYWGNMLDVLPALCDMSRYAKITDHVTDRALILQARLRTRNARPLPGFLLLENEQDKIAPLLKAIFSTAIDGKTIEDILNGKTRTSLPL